ncbi:unnamed protein product [Lupinus luteus]|uniref:Uncharacterized protein n=1 Tax=Lupinus luteus TaxID=3873 RepID=A0AAV1Y193_LUPLU
MLHHWVGTTSAIATTSSTRIFKEAVPPQFQQHRPANRDQADRHRTDNRRPMSPVDINTTSGGFAAGGTSRSAQKRYVREVMHVAARDSQRRQNYSTTHLSLSTTGTMNVSSEGMMTPS